MRYPDLTADWRTTLSRVRRALGLRLEPGPEATPHPVDDFIDAGLRRREPGWDDTADPARLHALADAVFVALGETADDDDPGQSARLDALSGEYAALHAEALDVVRHHVMRERRQGRRARRRKAEERWATRDPEVQPTAEQPRRRSS